RLRLLKALAWLKGDMPIQEISWRLGYGSTSAFIAMFNRALGCSPQRYRLQSAGRHPQVVVGKPADGMLTY
ncbi:MAG: helix-turn-helix domain-containing protein, partial [Aeromonas sobria]